MNKNVKPKFVNINYTKIYVKMNHSKQLQNEKMNIHYLLKNVKT